MTMADDYDAQFKAMMEGAGLEEPKDVVDFSTLDILELSTRYNAVKKELLDRAETIEQTTDRGRELHSERTALVLELRKRGWK